MTLREYRRFVQVALRASVGLSIVTVLVVMLVAVAPLLAAAAVGAVVAQVPAESALWWGIAAGGLFLLQWTAGALQGAASTALGERIDAVLQRDLMVAVLRPTGIGHLEDARTLGLITVGRETFRAEWARPGRLAATLSRLAVCRVWFVGSCLIIGGFHPLLGVVLLSAGLWASYEDKLASRTESAHNYRGTEMARRAEYYNDLGVTQQAAKEVRVFGLASFLVERFFATWRSAMVDVLAPAGRRPVVATAVLGAVTVLGIGWIAWEAAVGRVGVGPAVAYAQVLLVGIGGMQQSAWAGLQTELALSTLRRYDEAVVAVDVAEPPARGLPADGLPDKEIRFEGVTFSYASGAGDVLRELDLVIPAGRSLAIVGANGAGKTTVVKLLCRLYEPTNGRITVDDVDLIGLDVVGWRRQLAAVFQDSTRFVLPARTNIEFGRVDASGDRAGVEAAAAEAGIAEAIAGLPSGWDTPLSPEYAGGVDLSGGEWQKLGLARARFAARHGASVLILDEPAAHLDARSEARLYERFLALTAGLTTIVISHRFSTVRQASSIAVLDEGRVVEQGNHEELLVRDGVYASMFRMQAARFSDPAQGDPEGSESKGAS